MTEAIAQLQRQVVKQREQEYAKRWPCLLPLAAGTFLGAAVIELLPEALERTGQAAWWWALGGLLLFTGVHRGLDALGRSGLAWIATLGIWLHSSLEGAVAATSYGVSLSTGLLVSAGMIFHLIPEVAAVVAVLGVAGLSLRQALVRNAIAWALLLLGSLAVFRLLPTVSTVGLGALLGVGCGGFLCLAFVSWRKRTGRGAAGALAASAGVAVIALVRVLG